MTLHFTFDDPGELSLLEAGIYPVTLTKVEAKPPKNPDPNHPDRMVLHIEAFTEVDDNTYQLRGWQLVDADDLYSVYRFNSLAEAAGVSHYPDGLQKDELRALIGFEVDAMVTVNEGGEADDGNTYEPSNNIQYLVVDNFLPQEAEGEHEFEVLRVDAKPARSNPTKVVYHLTLAITDLPERYGPIGVKHYLTYDPDPKFEKESRRRIFVFLRNLEPPFEGGELTNEALAGRTGRAKFVIDDSDKVNPATGKTYPRALKLKRMLES